MTNIDRLTKIARIANPLNEAVQNVEQASHEIAGAIGGSEKRAAAVELVLNSLKLRIVPKWIQRLAIGKMIDTLVVQLNDENGHDWRAGKCAT